MFVKSIIKSREELDNWAEVEKNIEVADESIKDRAKNRSDVSKKLESSHEVTDSRDNQLDDKEDISVQL